MKKLFLILCLMVISTSSIAAVNFTSSSGALVMRNVTVDDNTVFDSVTLQLDLANGTFSILDATPKDTSFSEIALDSLIENGIKIDFFGCNLTGKNQITCMTKIVSLSTDQSITVRGDLRGVTSKLFDDQSREYLPTAITALDNTHSSVLTFNIIQGIPVEVKFIYSGINSAATSISVFQPTFEPESGFVDAEFRDIEF